MPVDSIYQVIAARFFGSTVLRAAIPGGLWPGRAREDTTGVYGTYITLSATPGWATEYTLYTEPTRVQITLFGPSAASVDTAIRTLCSTQPDGFDRLRNFSLASGTVIQATRISGPIGPMLDESPGIGGARVWMSTVDYLFHVSRSL